MYIRPIGRFLLLLSQIVTVLVAAETQPTVLQCWRKTSQWAKIKVSAELCSFKRLKQKNQSFLFLAFSSFTGCLHPFVHGPFSSVWPLLLFSRLWLSSPASPLQGPLWWRQDHLGNSRLLPRLKTHYLITSAKSLSPGRHHAPRFCGWGHPCGSILLSATAVMMNTGEGQGEDHFY